VTRLVLRLLLVPIGIGLAAIAAFVTGLVGAISSGYGASLAELAAATGLSLAAAAAAGADPSQIGDFVMLLVYIGLGVVFVPIILVALVGEVFGMTSWIAYAFGTGGLFTLVPILFPGDPATHGWPANALLGFFSTGLVAGSVYWLVAGRGARKAAVLPQPDGA
jgi:hypothetical protein